MSLRDKDVLFLILNLKRKVETALISEQRDEKLRSAGGAQSDPLDPPSILVSILT